VFPFTRRIDRPPLLEADLLGDDDGVERGATEQLVAADEEVEAAVAENVVLKKTENAKV